MRNSNQQSIGDLLSQLIKENKLEDRMQEVEIISCWNAVVGEFIAKHTQEIRINKSTLFVNMNSPACREELMYRKSSIIEEVNKHFKKNIIKDIVIR